MCSQIILIFSLIDFIFLDGLEQFKRSLLAQPCPSWLGLLGWCMTLSSIWLIPAYAVYLYTQTDGATVWERLDKISSPPAPVRLPKSVSSSRAQDITFKTSVNATAL